jgi:lysophospholipase L1-like esterase
VFVLGESTTAGFPYPSNGSFSRVLDDVLTDVLPEDTVEVVNLGIPATTSFALVDELTEVLDQAPDAVMIYGGHNEYYGALGSASTIRGGHPAVVRFVLRLRRLRTVQLMSDGVGRAVRSFGSQQPRSASRMEELAAERNLRLGGSEYRRGVDQFESNLRVLLRELRSAGVPTFVASLTSNVRDQPPFASDSGDASVNASLAFSLATAALERGDSTSSGLFERARDLDLVRFRAPSDFDSVVRRVGDSEGATYVPVREMFETVSRGKSPGRELFFEHLHPRPEGTVLIARSFYEALARRGFLGRSADTTRRADWSDYRRRMALTALDDRIAGLAVLTLTNRWPFVPASESRDALAAFRPATLIDSFAIKVVRGEIGWANAKAGFAAREEALGRMDAAVAEYQGLMRDQPWNEGPFRFAGRALLAVERRAEALPLLERAYTLEPTAFTCYALGVLSAGDERSLPRAVTLFERSLALGPDNPAALYQLSLAYGRLQRLDQARQTAARLARLSPNFPGLGAWLGILGMK